MAEYLPVKEDGDELSPVAGAAITGGQLVFVSAANTVSPTTAATPKFLGVAGYDAGVGDLVTVYCEGVHESTATGTIAAGDTVEAAAAGTVATHTLGTNDTSIVGLALTAATNGTKVRWRRI
jgi:Uncharacterized conserved protein (DUF2190)